MSDRERSGEDLRAWFDELATEGESGEPEIRITSFDSPHISADAARIEHPAPSWRAPAPEERDRRIARQKRPADGHSSTRDGGPRP
jgi:hypothetical protein